MSRKYLQVVDLDLEMNISVLYHGEESNLACVANGHHGQLYVYKGAFPAHQCNKIMRKPFVFKGHVLKSLFNMY